MILKIILLVLIILILSMLILFIYEILFPSLKEKKIDIKNPIVSYSEKNHIVPEIKDFNVTDKRAYVFCNCEKEFKNPRSIFNKNYSCLLAKNNMGSGTDCKFACIGLGDCVKCCPQNAIYIKNKTAVISNMCCGCGKCIEICPQNIIKFVNKTVEKTIVCSNNFESQLTFCTKKLVEEKVEWTDKKDFKIWTFCYRLFKRVVKNSK